MNGKSERLFHAELPRKEIPIYRQFIEDRNVKASLGQINPRIATALTIFFSGTMTFSELGKSIEIHTRERARQVVRGAFNAVYNCLPESLWSQFPPDAVWEDRVAVSRKMAREAQKGKPGHPHTVETKARLSEIGKGRHHTEETRAKLSKIFKGREFTQETRVKLSEANKGKKRTAQTRLRLSVAKRGHTVSPETRLKMSLSHKERLRKLNEQQ